ncbi:hypothetical protein BN946_scf184966.g4 [Trametes cinnabarina]|uniref:Uncharacterized protein n=1 Tax=Pycnoporus cinnabarinus TaxID=5643 RepID=A0A060SMF0_PYCCI|nr:hypothetical protein BN946_scf184966.g4 [Trametes cinnabarina]
MLLPLVPASEDVSGTSNPALSLNQIHPVEREDSPLHSRDSGDSLHRPEDACAPREPQDPLRQAPVPASEYPAGEARGTEHPASGDPPGAPQTGEDHTQPAESEDAFPDVTREDIRNTLKYIDLLRSATLGASSLSDDVLEQLQNPLQEELKITDPDVVLSIELYMASANGSRET